MAALLRQAPAEWMTLADIAATLQISLSAAERLKAAGRLPPHVELSRRTHRFRRSDVEAWLEAQAEQARRPAR